MLVPVNPVATLCSLSGHYLTPDVLSLIVIVPTEMKISRNSGEAFPIAANTML